MSLPNKHRLPAFTIMELTVTMLISALVIGITYTAYSIISKSYTSYVAKREQMAVLIRLDELLQKDFSKASGIYLEPDDVFFTLSDQTKITYRFTPDYILRESAATDTFKVKNDSLRTYFEHQPLSADYYGEQEANRLDELSVTILSDQVFYPYHYQKLYSSKDLINRKTHAVH